MQKEASDSLSNRFSGELTLADRAQLTVGFDQLLAQQNREQISRIAIDDLRSDPLIYEGGGKISTDWLAMFWKNAENVSHKEMQVLWAKVLARKAKLPREISPRTVQLLSTLTYEEATMIQGIAPFVVSFHVTEGEYSSKVGGTFTSIGQYQGTFSIPTEAKKTFENEAYRLLPQYDRNALDAAGVMQSANGWASEYWTNYDSEVQLSIGCTRFCISGLPLPNKRYEKHYLLGSGSGFTLEGHELVQVCGMAADHGLVSALKCVLNVANCDLVKVV